MDADRTVFRGPNALRDYLDPARSPIPPLVELPDALNPFASDGVTILAKLMNALPLGNVKSLPAFSMIQSAAASGELDDATALVENSSGNTVLSEAVIARHFGIHQTRALVSSHVSPGKLNLLRFLGVEIVVRDEPICPDPSDPESGICAARRQGDEPGWFNPGQYDNEQNPAAHERWTGPQLWDQTQGELSVFCAGLGTTGTLVGVSRAFQKQSAPLTTIGVVRAPNNAVPGPRTLSLLQEIAFDWRSHVTAIEEVGVRESYARSMELSRYGVFVGPSSGFALQGLLQFLTRERDAGNLDAHRNAQGRVVAAFICCDSFLPYIQQYEEILGPRSFPPILHAELLVDRPKDASPSTVVPSISPIDAIRLLYGRDTEALRNAVNSGATLSLEKGVALLDIRGDAAYAHVHLPCSTLVDSSAVSVRPPSYLRGKTAVVTCAVGQRSHQCVESLRAAGINAFSLQGGIAEWSALDLPRIRPAACARHAHRPKRDAGCTLE